MIRLRRYYVVSDLVKQASAASVLVLIAAFIFCLVGSLTRSHVPLEKMATLTNYPWTGESFLLTGVFLLFAALFIEPKPSALRSKKLLLISITALLFITVPNIVALGSVFRGNSIVVTRMYASLGVLIVFPLYLFVRTFFPVRFEE